MITTHQIERPLHSSQSPFTHTYSQAIQGQVHHQHTPPPDHFHSSLPNTPMLPFQHHPMDRHPQHMRQESVHVIHTHSPTPPAAISDQSHLRNSSAPYSHEMGTPAFHFHHHPAMYNNGSYQGGEALMMNQHEHSTPLLSRPVVHAHPAPPPPSVLPPLLPPLLPQFVHPYLAQNQHRERGSFNSNHHHQQEGLLHIGQSSSSIERDDESHRERHFSGQGMRHLPASSHQQAVPPFYPTIYGGGNHVPQDRIRGSPGYDSHRTSFLIPSPGHLFQAEPHTSRHYSIQHSTASLDASSNEAGPSAIYTAPRHPESHSDRNGASPSAAGQSPTYQRRGSLLRHSESIIETSKEDFSSASPSRITPNQHRTPARQLERNHHHHHHHHAHASSPSKIGSPFIIGGESGEQHSLFPWKKRNNPSRYQHHRRASIASTTISYHAARTDSIKASNAVMNDSSHLGENEDHRPSSPNPPPLVEPSEGPHFPISTHPYPSSAAGGGGGNADPQQQPFLQYQPCLNPGCPNIYHYAQQIYQPTPTPAPAHSYASRYDSARSEMTTTFKFVEVPGMIQPPAWCELSPCGCTLCRDCFSFTITNCEISPPDISQGQYEPVRLFKCIICNAPAREFGPINVEVQDVVESGKTLFGGYPEDHLHQNYTLSETSYTQNDSETTFENTKDTANQSIQGPRTIFEGFQSAQDVASGAHSNTITSGHVPSGNATKSEAGSSTSIATSLLLPSPSKSGIRYPRSDPPPSIPSLSPLIVAQRELDDMRTDLTAPSESKTEPINDPLVTITPSHPHAGGNRAEDIAALAKDAALVFPTLFGIENTTVPTRKVSTTSTIATSYDSPVFQTPDLGTCSSSSASTTALNSPEALHSPTVPLTSEGQAPRRQKALPEFYEAKAVKTGDQRDDAQDKERQAKLDEDFKRLSVHAKKDESDNATVGLHSVGLGLTFGTVTPGKPVKTTAPTRNDSRTNEESLHIATFVSTPIRPPETPKPQALVSASSVQKAPHRAPATPSSTRSAKVDSTSPTSHIKSRAVSNIQLDRSPLRPPRGRGRGGSHCPSVSHLGQEKHAHKPSSSTVSYNSARSRTDTQSSVQTASSSISGSSSSHGALFSSNHRLHNRKVPMAENKSPRLPDLINNPSDEMLRIWEENKARWWKDPWTGKLMGVKQKTVGVEKSMVKSDGSLLVRERGAGISWPILKVHNIHFRTTIADIESFVPPGVLAPLDHNAQGIHILCDATDAKTRPYAYVECISAAAAEHLIAVSDGQYLAGRQVAFEPVTQKELVLDLFRHVKRGGYYKPTILEEDPPTSKGSSHQRQHSYYDRAGDLELFTAEDDLQLRRLFDHTLPGTPESGDGSEVTKDESEPAMYFSFPIERPFARLTSMIVKYPCHILVGPARTSEKQVQATDRLFKCLLYAMEKLAPHSEVHPSLHAVLHRLYRAALQCPAFDEQKEVLTEKWANFTGDENVYAI